MVVIQARSASEPELLQAQRRRREPRDAERANGARRPRRRRQSTPWLQRNALSVAALSVLIAFLGLGFGFVQMLNHAESPSAPVAALQSDLVPTSNTAGLVGPGAVEGGAPEQSAAGVSPPAAIGGRAITASAKVLEPNYTIAAGDTLVKIAARFNTTADRIQAFNNLADPRSLRIGAKLIIPPAL